MTVGGVGVFLENVKFSYNLLTKALFCDIIITVEKI